MPYVTVFDLSANKSDSFGPMPALPTEQPAELVLNGFEPVAGTVEPSYVPVPAVETTGVYVPRPHDDWYYRFHFLPPRFDLGNLSGDAQRTMYLWNANFTSATIEDFEILNGAGISYSSDITIPGDMLPLKLARFDFLVQANGPAVIDADAVWTIDGEQYIVEITGRRVTLFPFKPNWSGQFKDTYAWVSTVRESYSGKEQRMSLTSNPRRSFVYNIRERGNAAAMFDVLTFGWQGRMYAHPIWIEGRKLTASVPAGSLVLPVTTTDGMSIKAGSSVALMRSSSDYEILQIDTFGPTSITLIGETATEWLQGAKVFPLVASLMDTNLSTSRAGPRYLDAAMRFVANPLDLVNRIPEIPPEAEYLGEELYTKETNWRTGVPITINGREIRSDAEIGPIRVQPRATFPLITRRFDWMLKSQDAALFLLGFFGRRLGRTVPVWMPSGTDDFYVTGHVAESEAAVPVMYSEYPSLIAGHPARKHVIFIMRNGTRHCRELQSVTTEGGSSVLNLSSPLGFAFDPADVKRVSYLGLYRLGSDEVTFNWHTDEVAEVTVNFVLTEPEAP
jgi:hypothetical protein